MCSRLVGTSVACDFVPTLQVWRNWLSSLSAACFDRRRQGDPARVRPENSPRLCQGVHVLTSIAQRQEFEMRKRTGGCNCGKFRFQVEGNPIRVGVCHCQICRKDTGSAFNFFAVWSAETVTTAGDTKSWMHSTDHRHFCATCGSSLFSVVDGANELEFRVGAFDEAPSDLVPTYELWLNRREIWLKPIDGAEQYAGNRS
jgi:hypothetical protein